MEIAHCLSLRRLSGRLRGTDWPRHPGGACVPKEIDKGDFRAQERDCLNPVPLEASEEVGAANQDKVEMVRGSSGIYADFGDPDAETKQLKARLAAEIIKALDERKLTVRDGAVVIGATAADLSRIRNAELGRFTIDRLVRILGRLDRRVTVTMA